MMKGQCAFCGAVNIEILRDRRGNWSCPDCTPELFTKWVDDLPEYLRDVVRAIIRQTEAQS